MTASGLHGDVADTPKEGETCKACWACCLCDSHSTPTTRSLRETSGKRETSQTKRRFACPLRDNGKGGRTYTRVWAIAREAADAHGCDRVSRMIAQPIRCKLSARAAAVTTRPSGLAWRSVGATAWTGVKSSLPRHHYYHHRHHRKQDVKKSHHSERLTHLQRSIRARVYSLHCILYKCVAQR